MQEVHLIDQDREEGESRCGQVGSELSAKEIVLLFRKGYGRVNRRNDQSVR